MVGGLLSEVLAFAPDSATLIALSVVLPVLFLFYVHYSVGARRCRRVLCHAPISTALMIAAPIHNGAASKPMDWAHSRVRAPPAGTTT